MEMISSARCFEGEQRRYRHASKALGCEMTFSLFMPPGKGRFPLLWWLSGLTCTDENFVTKAGAQRTAAKLGIAIICPDTSPRGEGVADAESYDLGQGAGFFLNATREPWAAHYRMHAYVTEELPELVAKALPLDMSRQSISGHSMGGHGALVTALKNPDRFRAVSAFAPIVAPTQVPWGRKAFSAYLGEDEAVWAAWDATELLKVCEGDLPPILVDQGEADAFLTEQLRPELFEVAAKASGRRIKLRRRPGYDHSYFFIATFIGAHMAFHARALMA